MNKFDMAIKKCQSSGFRKLITQDIVKTLELGKIYQELWEKIGNFHGDPNKMKEEIELIKKKKEIERYLEAKENEKFTK